MTNSTDTSNGRCPYVRTLIALLARSSEAGDAPGSDNLAQQLVQLEQDAANSNAPEESVTLIHEAHALITLVDAAMPSERSRAVKIIHEETLAETRTRWPPVVRGH